MEIGIDSFAAIDIDTTPYTAKERARAIQELIDRIVFADTLGIDLFGVGEHHRKEFLDSAQSLILAAAASKTKNITLGSAVTVLSAADPVRIFQQFATLDLISEGRAEIVVGRGSFTEAFPLFGYNMEDYNELFTEKLHLLLEINKNKSVTWSGKFRPALDNAEIFPRPFKEKLPIWVGVGGTPESFIRAGTLGLPLAVAVIGGETRRFRPLIDLYKEAGIAAGHSPEKLEVGLHSLGYVAENRETAIETYFPGYARAFTKIGQERGWPPVERSRFDAQTGELGAIVIGDAEEVAQKIVRHSEALGGISRFTFQLDNAGLTHEQLLAAIELIGKKVKPLVDKYTKKNA